MLKESSVKLEGNDRYEGFGIELIDELAKTNEFNYTFEIQADGVYGSYDKNTGKWTGMMEKVMDGVSTTLHVVLLNTFYFSTIFVSQHEFVCFITNIHQCTIFRGFLCCRFLCLIKFCR